MPAPQRTNAQRLIVRLCVATVRCTAVQHRAHKVTAQAMAIVQLTVIVQPVRPHLAHKATAQRMAIAQHVQPVPKVSAQTASDLKLVYSVLQIAKQALHRRQGSTTSSKPKL